jgi:uncharacterized protein (DUF362 family)
MALTGKKRSAKKDAARGNALIALRRVGTNPGDAVKGVLEAFPETVEKLKRCRRVFIKVNAVYFHPYLFTSPSLIVSAIEYIRRHDPQKTIYIMDNCSQGNFTRLCFAATGIDKLAKKMNVRCLYLDEEKSVEVSLVPGSKERYEFPKILHEHLMDLREESFYLNMPVLKAHCQAQMTAGLKNQMGLLYDEDRARHHNYDLHQKIVDIYRYVQPDFTLIDAIKVLARGPMPAGRYVKELLHDRDLIIGGTDTVAADAVAAQVLGHRPSEVRHVKLAAESGLGIADPDRISLDGEMPPITETIPWEFLPHFPKSIRFVKGKERACYEGCVGHAEQVLELVVNDGSSVEKLEGKPLTIVTGRSFEEGQLSGLTEPIVVLGECACAEALPYIKKTYRKVDVLNTCGRCDNILVVSLKRLRVNPVRLATVSVPRLIFLWLIGKMHGLKYNLPFYI